MSSAEGLFFFDVFGGRGGGEDTRWRWFGGVVPRGEPTVRLLSLSLSRSGRLVYKPGDPARFPCSFCSISIAPEDPEEAAEHAGTLLAI